jgi:hypothetical protein
MSTILQQIKKALTLADISPGWAKKLPMGITEQLGNPMACVVGEAYHGDSSYNDCGECHNCSMRIYDSVNHTNETSKYKARGPIHYEVNRFVEHWNEVHLNK